MKKDDFADERRSMVENQIRARGIKDERVLRAMEIVLRHEFVPREMWRDAYCDRPLPIGEGQTISQPYMVALMSECLELRGDEKVLEVGTGSGYQSAVLSVLAGEVVSIEVRKSFFLQAGKVLDLLGYRNVRVVLGEGSLGYKEGAPYDRIIVTAGCEFVPDALRGQLSEGGVLVIPVGSAFVQSLLKIRKVRGEFIEEPITPCVFVPLVKYPKS